MFFPLNYQLITMKPCFIICIILMNSGYLSSEVIFYLIHAKINSILHKYCEFDRHVYFTASSFFAIHNFYIVHLQSFIIVSDTFNLLFTLLANNWYL